jgi:hypothetical protein
MTAAVAVMLALGWTAHADPVHPERVVIVPEVEVRSLPSPTAYVTGKLHQGDRVKVVAEKDGGWLAVEPPPGSFSWINNRLIDRDPQHPQYGMVLAPDTPVLIGSSVTNQEPNVQQVKLQRGTAVVILGGDKAYQRDGSGWLPIQPPIQEVRFIPADAVKAVPPVQVVSSAPPAAGPAAGAAGIPTLWAQAEEAEKAGNLAEAERLYRLQAHQSLDTDHDLAMRCYNRIHFLHEHGTTGAAPASPYYTTSGGGRLVPTPATVPGQAGAAYPAPAPQATSQYTYVRETPLPQMGQTPPITYQTPQPPPGPPAQWAGPGRLRTTALRVDGKPTYVLESNQGLPLFYLTAQPGVNLDWYLNRNVYLYGPAHFRGDVRNNYMVVAQVAPAP